MHQHIINASIQLLPVVQDKHPYIWVDEAIEVIQQSGLPYEVGPFATMIEGTYEQVTQVVNEVNKYLLGKQCAEWIVQFQLHIRSNEDMTANLKTSKYKVVQK